ncbi:hypothetical protein B0H13DRAFT_1850182 [Mycena leptocephala]|nr:hypothetical protein B0H13DRAFT_1850182 [Mycena leptocephala]
MNGIFHHIFHQRLNLWNTTTVIKKNRNFKERMGWALQIKIERYLSPHIPPDIGLMENDHCDKKKIEILKSAWVGCLGLKLNGIFHQIFHQILNLWTTNTLIKKYRNFKECMGRALQIKIERTHKKVVTTSHNFA